MGFSTQIINWMHYFSKNDKYGFLRLKIIDSGAKFGNNFIYGPKNYPFRIIKMGHVSEASAAHPYQKSGKLPPPHHPRAGQHHYRDRGAMISVQSMTKMEPRGHLTLSVMIL